VTPDIDVVIASRDRPARLAACLEALVRQTFKRFRVIVVDDGSTFPVANTLQAGLDKRHSLLVLRNESSKGPAASRNRGVAAGEARFLLFLDDDVRVHPELLARHYAVLDRNPRPVVSLGSVLPPADTPLAPWDLWQADRLAREHARLSRGDGVPTWTHVYTCNVALRRADFTAVGGFDVSFARQEDIELGFRLSQLGCRFVFEPAAVAWHYAEHSLADWLRLHSASAHYDALIDRLRPESSRLRSVREDLHRRHWLLRVARRGLRHPTVSRRAVRLASMAGGALHRAGAERLALPAFSLVWDLEYNRALAEAASDPRPHAEH
jgi:GT2 family glycosyltransferase